MSADPEEFENIMITAFAMSLIAIPFIIMGVRWEHARAEDRRVQKVQKYIEHCLPLSQPSILTTDELIVYTKKCGVSK